MQENADNKPSIDNIAIDDWAMNPNLNYERLTEIIEKVKPYKKTEKYPITFRHHRHKYFYKKVLNGEVVYEINYGYKAERIEYSEEEYKQIEPTLSKIDKRSMFESSNRLDDGTYQKIWVKYNHYDNPIGIVRKDNSFEFITNRLYQGTRMFLDNINWYGTQGGGFFKQDSRCGGVVHLRQADKKRTPIFENMRVYMHNFEPHESSLYKLISRKVNRTRAKEILRLHEDKIMVAETMIKAMGTSSLANIIEDVEKNLESTYYWDRRTRNNAIEYAKSIWNDDPVGAYGLMLKASRVNFGYISNGDITPQELIDRGKSKFNKIFYQDHDVLDMVESDHTKSIKRSDWRTDILVNGNAVKRVYG